MTEAKLMPGFEKHEKVEGCDLAAIGLFALGLSYSVRELTDGFIPAAWAEKKTCEPAGGSAAKQLLDEGLWEPVESGFRVHDFSVYNPTRAKLAEREKAADRQRRRRNRDVTTEDRDVTEEGGVTSRSEAAIPHSEAVSTPPLPQPGPTAPGNPSPGGVGGASRKERVSVLASLSSESSKRSSTTPEALSANRGGDDSEADWQGWLIDYREVSGNAAVLGSAVARRAFAARRREGRTLEQLMLATRGNCSQQDLVDRGFDRPETILRASKVERYILLGERLASGHVPSEHPASRRIRDRVARSGIAVAG
jgi:hypothetical protein